MSVEHFKVQTVDVSVPAVTTNTDGYKSRNVFNYHIRMRSYHIDVLHRIAKGLILKGAKLADKRLVDSPATAITWILEQIEAKSPAQPTIATSEPAREGTTSTAPYSGTSDPMTVGGNFQKPKIENQKSEIEKTNSPELEI